MSDYRYQNAFGPFLLKPAEHELLRNGQSVPLFPKTFEILVVLVCALEVFRYF